MSTVDFPLGTFICVTGVSAAQASPHWSMRSLTKGLQHALGASAHQSRASIRRSAASRTSIRSSISTQDPIGRTPRSNPATYTGVFDDIRELFAQTPEAKLRGYEYRALLVQCERRPMRGLPGRWHPAHLRCISCRMCMCRVKSAAASATTEETLQVTYKGKNIYDVLEMSGRRRPCDFFSGRAQDPPISCRRSRTWDLGYVKLGQSGDHAFRR